MAVTIRSTNEVINMISEVLAEADGKFIQEIASKVLTEEVKYLEDGFFSVKPTE
jgi:hypothetical protein